ncbi:hypothetical protein LSAT2_007668 [Lamellibrachia satsuma]|nr:hypothetical protein LSAT2_007668 [Lamellibrachia satsuma]
MPRTRIFTLILVWLLKLSQCDQLHYVNTDGLCDGSPCQHGGQCSVWVTFAGRPVVHCQCKPTWYGSRCQEFESCEDKPCINGGVCAAGKEGQVCKCPIGYRGVYCEVETNVLASLHRRLVATLRKWLPPVETVVINAVIFCVAISAGLAVGCCCCGTLYVNSRMSTRDRHQKQSLREWHSNATTGARKLVRLVWRDPYKLSIMHKDAKLGTPYLTVEKCEHTKDGGDFTGVNFDQKAVADNQLNPFETKSKLDNLPAVA